MSHKIQRRRCTKCRRLKPLTEFYAGIARCKKCLAPYHAAYRAANTKRLKAYQKAYKTANRERLNAYSAAYYAANRERIAARKAALFYARKKARWNG